MVFDATVGGPTVGPCRSELPLLSDKTRFNAQWSTLAAKAPAQSSVSQPDAQTHRLRIQQVSAHLSNDPKNDLNMTRESNVRIMFF